MMVIVNNDRSLNVRQNWAIKSKIRNFELVNIYFPGPSNRNTLYRFKTGGSHTLTLGKQERNISSFFYHFLPFS